MDILAFDLSWLLTKSLSILYAALGLVLVIFFHELGHFAVAKWCGVFVERFSIGFGPILWSFKRGDTEYALSAFPLGGYVKMLGQDDMDPSQLSSDEIAQDPRSYSAKSVPQRMAIISAGVIMNIVTGLAFFAIAFRCGVETAPAVVGSVAAGKPAWEKGVQPGDRITRINGREVHGFLDILRGTTLSRGDIRIEGIRPDGSTFDFVVAPDRGGLRRMIGVGPAESLEVSSAGSESGKPDAPGWSVLPGSPAAEAKPGFEKGDRILEVGGQPVTTHAELQRILARRRAEPLDFVVQRAGGQKVTVRVEPWKFREIGIRVDIEQIAAIQEGSPAATAGLKVGDKIMKINGLDVGKQIHPLHLADHLETLAGQPVEIVVKRTVGGAPEPERVTVTLVPQDTPAWIDHPIQKNVPLSIPSIGVAFHLSSNILRVKPDSPAAKAGVPEGVTLQSMKIEALDPELKAIAGRDVVEIEFNNPAKPGERNMAWALWTLQEIPRARVTLTLQGDGQKSFTMETVATDSDWYLPRRGMILKGLSQTLVAGTWGEAFGMAVHHTRDTALDIYLTIRNLISRDLSVKNLHGPVGIASVAVEVAQQGLPRLLLFLGFLSVNLAVLNFLPIPVLDGGHMVFLIWEGVTRRRPSERVLIAATYCGMAFVLGLMLFVIYLDIFVHRLGI